MEEVCFDCITDNKCDVCGFEGLVAVLHIEMTPVMALCRTCSPDSYTMVEKKRNAASSANSK